MAIENLDSSFISAKNTVPRSALTAGEGAPGVLRVVTDIITPTASGLASVGSTYRLCRFPTQAKIKSVILDLGGIDTNAAPQAQFDVNVAFSDDPADGTQPALQSTIPTTALNGAVTTIGAYVAPNKLFGTIIAAASGSKKLNNQMMFNANVAGWFPGGRELPLWDYFGFLTSTGQAQDPGGYFDLLLYLNTVAATPASAPIAARVEFVV